MSYIRGLAASPDQPPEDKGCFLCQAAAGDPHTPQGRQQMLLLRDDRGLVMLNRFPYTNGHLLVAPLVHVGELSDITAAQRTDLMELTELGSRLLKAAVNPQGINIGINMGRCAGAGVPGHLHVHLVPRWNGDTNFMHTVGKVQVIPQALEESHAHLARVLASLGEQ